MKFPSDMTVSYNHFNQFGGENIDIQVTYTTSFMFDCAVALVDRGWEGSKNIGEASGKYGDALIYLRDTGNVNGVMKEMESLTCGFAGSNLSAKPIKIDGLNGVIYNKVTGNSGSPSLSTFFKQIILVGPGNQVTSIVFNYEFSDLGRYINSVKGEFGEAILEDNQKFKYDQVMNYLEYGNPITDVDVKAFEENDKAIDEIIKTLRIQR